jgi:DNA-binding transcriptional LysR family regulator
MSNKENKKVKNELTNPHDVTFKKLFSNIEIAKDIIEKNLPQEILQDLEINTLEKLRVVAYIENQEAIKEAVKAGLGVTVISYKAVHQELAAGLMKGYRMPDLQLERNLYLIYRNNCVFSPLCQAFLEHCLGSFKAED